MIMPKFICLAAFMLNVLLVFGNADAQAKPTLFADTNRPDTSTFYLGEKVEVTFTAAGLADNETLKLILDVRNELGKSIAKPEPIALAGNAGGKAQYVYSAPADKFGYYEINAKLSDGSPLASLGSRPSGIISYAVVPNPRNRIDYGDELSRFGLLGGFSTSAVVIPYLGIRYMLSGYDWALMEPDSSGQFREARDKADHAGKRHPPKASEYEKPIFQGKEWTTYHLSLLTKAGLPAWARKAKTEGTSCKKFGELNEQGIKALPLFAESQAQAFAADYKNQKTRYYQITWEPAEGWCFGGTPEGLVKIYAQSYEAIHQGDPHAVVAGPTLFIEEGATKQLEGLWAAGLGKYIDALSIHPYGPQWPPEKNGLPTVLHKQLQAAVKAVGRPIPFIGTEHGYCSNRIGNLNKALGDARTTIIVLGEGASLDMGFYVADFWDGDDPLKTDGYGFYWNLNPRIQHGTDKLGPKIIVPSYAAMTYFLDGTTSEGALPNIKGTQMGYRFKKAHATIDVVWDYGSSSSYKISAGTKVCDWMGNCAEAKQPEMTIGGAPTYIIAGKTP